MDDKIEIDICRVPKAPLTNLDRIATWDGKMWLREEAKATRNDISHVWCMCRICWRSTYLKRKLVKGHLRKHGRHERLRVNLVVRQWQFFCALLVCCITSIHVPCLFLYHE